LAASCCRSRFAIARGLLDVDDGLDEEEEQPMIVVAMVFMLCCL
jgi:hypothetical protein